METFQQDWADRHLMGLWQVTPWQLKFNSLFMGELQSKHKCHCHSIKWIFEVKTTTVQHCNTVKNSNNFVHISARHLEELFWIYFPASSLSGSHPCLTLGFKSSQQRNNGVKKRLIGQSTTPNPWAAQDEAEHWVCNLLTRLFESFFCTRKCRKQPHTAA